MAFWEGLLDQLEGRLDELKKTRKTETEMNSPPTAARSAALRADVSGALFQSENFG
jgi:hypothetical protein